MAKKGVLLINVGTPDEPTIKSVRNYLREFLLDPDVIDAPYIIRQLLVRGIILRVRPKKIAPLYQKIWMDEGSPLRVYSDRITKSLNDMIEDVEFDFAMRYGNPSIEAGLKNLRGKGVDELLLLPMFPHYAQATTESSLKHSYKQLSKMDWNPKIIEMGHFETDEEYVIPLTKSIQPHIDKDTHLLFSYHGLPVSHVKRIDKTKSHCQKVSDCCAIKAEANQLCYGHHCMETTLTVVGLLGLQPDQWSISYQSRIGPVKW
ncbi:MAG: ferrochelatase, partial [Candidatus Thermoplasmatota archaeon]|nr:ferrochelatase [Candidatus Thermoplasmatota archaeon]